MPTFFTTLRLKKTHLIGKLCDKKNLNEHRCLGSTCVRCVESVSDILGEKRNVNPKVSVLCRFAAFSAQRDSPAACLPTGPVEILEVQLFFFFAQCICIRHDCKDMHICWLMHIYCSHSNYTQHVVNYTKHRPQTCRQKYKRYQWLLVQPVAAASHFDWIFDLRAG